ncbi:MAG: rhodanese-like domain-containing protein [Bacteroidetes bacterium]|nr:rhodanese-like domain-containing protein [Bacteroidota bacterium]
MKYLLAIAALTFLLACGNPKESEKTANADETIAKDISADAFKNKIETLENELLLDVRTTVEFNSGHLKDALHIDWNSTNFEAEIKKLDNTKPVLIYCLSGGRSGAAMKRLTSLGFKEVYNLKGGISAWKQKGFPVE